jgi:hypothetical protein
VFLPWMALAVGLVVAWLPRELGAAIVAVSGVWIAWMLSLPAPPDNLMLLSAIAPGLLYGLLAPAARRAYVPRGIVPTVAAEAGGPPPTLAAARLAAVMLVVSLATTCVALVSSSIQFGKQTLSLSAAAGGLLAATLLPPLRWVNLSRGALAGFVLNWTMFLTFALIWADVPQERIAALAAAPLALWLGELPWIRHRTWAALGMVLAGTIGLACLAAVPAAREILEQMRRSQHGGY